MPFSCLPALFMASEHQAFAYASGCSLPESPQEESVDSLHTSYIAEDIHVIRLPRGQRHSLASQVTAAARA